MADYNNISGLPFEKKITTCVTETHISCIMKGRGHIARLRCCQAQIKAFYKAVW